MAKQNKFPQYTTKPMVLLWPHLDHEESYQGKPTGKFAITGRFEDITDTNALLQQLEGVYEVFKAKEPAFAEFKPKAKSVPSFGERENDKGEITFKFTTKSTWKNKAGEEMPKVVPVFDAKGKPYTGPIGNGSIGLVCYTVAPKTTSTTNYGTSLWLNAIQILELKEFSGGTQEAGNFGFSEQEGFEGFTEEMGQENPFLSGPTDAEENTGAAGF
nr:hypothetical protein [uncultured Anaeromusa sp.]